MYFQAHFKQTKRFGITEIPLWKVQSLSLIISTCADNVFISVYLLLLTDTANKKSKLVIQ